MKKVIVIALFFASCSTPSRINVPSTNSSHSIIDGKIYATAYQQTAAEYRALCYQAFNIAKLRIEQFNRERSPKPKAIMSDVDETILNNSPYEAHQLLQAKDYDHEPWKEWASKSEADTLPGAAGFLKYAASTGIEIYYVTNRGEAEREGTLRNLQKFNLPYADNNHLLLEKEVSSKEERKKSITANHTIVLLLGDNMNDFSFLFEKKSSDERNKIADSFSHEFGNRFILLPNPVYGDWESSLYHYNYSLLPAQKDSVIKAALRTY